MKKLMTVTIEKRLLTAALTVGLVLSPTCICYAESATEKISETDELTTVGFPQVIVDNDQVHFEILSEEEDSLWGYTWKVNIQNKMADADMMFALDDVSVNGITCDPFWAEEVTAGNQANDEISWFSSDFEENGIAEVTEVSFELHVYDNNDFMKDYLKETYTVYPKGEAAAVNVSKEAGENDIVLFDTDQCAMWLTGVDPNGDWGYTLKATLVNRSDLNLMFSADDVAVNKTMCDPFWADSVPAGKTSNQEIAWMSSTLEDAGIDPSAITEISMKLSVYDDDDFMADHLIDQDVTITSDQLQQLMAVSE